MNTMPSPFPFPLPSSKKIPDSKFERIFASGVSFVIIATLCIVWYQNQEQLFQRLNVSDEEEYRAYLNEKILGVWLTLLLFSFIFILKAYYLTPDRRKGSARLELNWHANVFFALKGGGMLIGISGVLDNQGLIGKFARAISALIAVGCLAMLKMMYRRWEFIDQHVIRDFIRVGDILGYSHNRGDIPNIDNGRYEVIDTHLRGIGGVIAKDVNTGQMVDIRSTTARRAMVGRD